MVKKSDVLKELFDELREKHTLAQKRLHKHPMTSQYDTDEEVAYDRGVCAGVTIFWGEVFTLLEKKWTEARKEEAF